jgi:hypothetical protein
MLMLALACARTPTGARPLAEPAHGRLSWGDLDPPRQGRPLVLITMPDGPAFHLVRWTAVRELVEDFDVITRPVNGRTSLAEFAGHVDLLQPRCLLVMDRPGLALYQQLTEARPRSRAPPPAVVAMSPFFIEDSSRARNTTGVSYEVPGVTAFAKLRAVIARPVRKVAVVHSARLRSFIQQQQRLAVREDVVLLSLEVSADPSAQEVRAALARARAPDIDALWVLSERRVLKNAAFIDEVWRPQLHLFQVPVIAGIHTLMSREAKLATFAVVPDHEELGLQAARLLMRVAESGWSTEGHAVEAPIATWTMANLARLQQLVGLRPGAAALIDEVVE